MQVLMYIDDSLSEMLGTEVEFCFQSKLVERKCFPALASIFWSRYFS